MAQRLDLQVLLEDLLGSRNVYFQPPSTLQMEYPAIVYNLDTITITHADNTPYKHQNRYQITHMDRDPDSDIPQRIAMLPTCAFAQAFTFDNLHHTVFTLFF